MRFRRWLATLLTLALLLSGLVAGSGPAASAATDAGPPAAETGYTPPGGGMLVGSLTVTPAFAVVGPGESVALEVRGYTVDGSSFTVPAELLAFTVVGAEEGAVISDAGRLAALEPGRYEVHARFHSGGPPIRPAVVGVHGPPARLLFIPPDGPVVGGVPATFAVVAADEMGIPVPSMEGVALVDWGAGPQEVMIQGGRGHVEVLAEPDVILTLTGALETSVGLLRGEDEVAVEAQQPSAVQVTAADEYLIANTGEETARVELAVLDQAGNPMADGQARAIDVQVEGPATLASGERSDRVIYTAAPGGESRAEVVLKSVKGETGPVTVTAALPGGEPVTAELEAVIAGRPVRVVVETEGLPVAEVGEVVTLRTEAQDRNGVPVPAEGPVVLRIEPQTPLEQSEGGDAGADQGAEDTDLPFLDVETEVGERVRLKSEVAVTVRVKPVAPWLDPPDAWITWDIPPYTGPVDTSDDWRRPPDAWITWEFPPQPVPPGWEDGDGSTEGEETGLFEGYPVGFVNDEGTMITTPLPEPPQVVWPTDDLRKRLGALEHLEQAIRAQTKAVTDLLIRRTLEDLLSEEAQAWDELQRSKGLLPDGEIVVEPIEEEKEKEWQVPFYRLYEYAALWEADAERPSQPLREAAIILLWRPLAERIAEWTGEDVEEVLRRLLELVEEEAETCNEIRQMRQDLISRYEYLLYDLNLQRERVPELQRDLAESQAELEQAQQELEQARARLTRVLRDPGMGAAERREAREAVRAAEARVRAAVEMVRTHAVEITIAMTVIAHLRAAAESLLAQIAELERLYPECFEERYEPESRPADGALPEESGGSDRPGQDSGEGSGEGSGEDTGGGTSERPGGGSGEASGPIESGEEGPIEEDEELDVAPPEHVGECFLDIWGKYEPAQGVWQDDEIFRDKPTKRLTEVTPKLFNAELDMVAGRPTLLWGVRDDRDTIWMEGASNYSTMVPVKIRFKVRDGSGERVLFEQPVGHAPLEGPCGEEAKGFRFELNARDGLLSTPFMIPAGGYRILMELVRENDGSVVDTVALYGDSVGTQGPNMLVTAAVLTAPKGDEDASRTAKPLLAAAERLATDLGYYVPDYFPVPTNSVLAAARPSFHDFREIQERIDSRYDGDEQVEEMTAALVAELNAIYIGSAWLSGFDRVVVVIRNEDWPQIEYTPDEVAAFTMSQKVVFVTESGTHWDVAHEIVHTLPFPWHDPDMRAVCDLNYHNSEANFGNGHRITLGGADARARQDRVPGLMGISKPPHDYWIEQCTYWHLLNVLQAVPDPELLGVRGILHRQEDGTVEASFLPGFTLMGEPDLSPEGTGDYALVVRDGAGEELARYPFEPFFSHTETGKAVDLISFGYRIPKPEGAARVEIHGPGGTLASSEISPAAPAVTITGPAPDQPVSVGPEGLTVSWDGSDADGDGLTYTLLYSPDGGQTWFDAVPVTESTTATVPADLLVPGGEHLFRVVATDGWNTTTYTLSQPFRVKGPERTILLPIGSPTATVDGATFQLDAPAMIVDDRTLVPLRFVSEALGADVGWDDATRQITVELDGTVVELWLNQTRARIDGREVALDVPPMIVNDRSLVPVRFVAEALGAEVEWDGQTRTVIIRR